MGNVEAMYLNDMANQFDTEYAEGERLSIRCEVGWLTATKQADSSWLVTYEPQVIDSNTLARLYPINFVGE